MLQKSMQNHAFGCLGVPLGRLGALRLGVGAPRPDFVLSWGGLPTSWGSLEAFLGRPWDILVASGGLLERSWGRLGSSWTLLARPWAVLESLLHPVLAIWRTTKTIEKPLVFLAFFDGGRVSELSWLLLWASSVVLVRFSASWGELGPFLAPFWASWNVLGPSWRALGASWARLGAVLASSWSPRACEILPFRLPPSPATPPILW